jgi:hypothetical protein
MRLVAGFPPRPDQIMWDLWWTKWYWGRCPPSTLVSPTSSHVADCSTHIIYHRGWYNRPVCGRRTKRTHSDPTPRRGKKTTYNLKIVVCHNGLLTFIVDRVTQRMGFLRVLQYHIASYQLAVSITFIGWWGWNPIQAAFALGTDNFPPYSAPNSLIAHRDSN